MDVLKYADINPDGAKNMAQRLHRKKDELNLVRKSVTVDNVESADEERSIVARVSTPDRDRDDEVVEPKGIDYSNYAKNPCLLWAHKYDVPAIGKAIWTKVDDKGLICKFQFAPTQFADEIYQLYKGGYQRAFSIGFIPVDFDAKTKTYSKVQLLEVSAVPVPSNQDALVMEAYAKGIIKSAELKKDLEIIDVTPTNDVGEATNEVGEPDAPAPAEEKTAEVTEHTEHIESSRTVSVAGDADCVTYSWSTPELTAVIEDVCTLKAVVATLQAELQTLKDTTCPPAPSAPEPAPEPEPAPSAPDPVAEPVEQVVEPIPAVPPADAEDVLSMLEDEAMPPSDGELDLDDLLKGPEFRATVADAMMIALAKLRGRVI